MGLPNIGKEFAMQERETKEEVLDRVLMKLSKLTDEQLERFVRLAREQGIELEEKEPRG
jgi:indole-3-glycerol phosphate synthase